MFINLLHFNVNLFQHQKWENSFCSCIIILIFFIFNFQNDPNRIFNKTVIGNNVKFVSIFRYSLNFLKLRGRGIFP